MPRSSRHKPHKHRERSDSEDEGTSRERRPREEPPASASGARVSRDPETEKRKSSSSLQPSQGKDVSGSGNGGPSVDHGKKRKERSADSAAVADRWNGGSMDDRSKDLKGEGFGQLDLEEMAEVNIIAVDSKARSSRRHEGSSERKEESVGKDDSAKRRLDKESGHRESSVTHKDAKDRDRERGLERERDRAPDRERRHVLEREIEHGSDRDRENWSERVRARGSERDRNVQDTRRERSDDAASRKQGSGTGGTEKEFIVKTDVENTDWQIQDELRNLDLEKELEKRIRKRREGSDDKDKWQGDGRDGEDSRLSYKDDPTKNSSHRDEKHKDEKYRDKYREDINSEERHQEDKYREDRSSRDHFINRSGSKHYRDENNFSENCYKKSKHQDSDLDSSPYTDDHGTKYKDNRVRKRCSGGNEDHNDLKSRNVKEPGADLEKNASTSYKVDSNCEIGRAERTHSDKVDSTLSNNRPKSSPSSSAQSVKDQYRHSSRQVESTHRNLSAEEKLRRRTASSDDLSGVIVTLKSVSEPRQLEKSKPREGPDSDELSVENTTSSQYKRTPRLDSHGSPIQLIEKPLLSASDRRLFNRTGARHSLDIDNIGQRSNSSKGGRDFPSNEDMELEIPVGRPAVDDRSQAELLNSDSVPAGLLFFNRTDHFSGGSPSHLPPPPPVRLGTDSPSVSGSFDEDDRVQVGVRKSSSRYKRNGDVNVGRGQGNTWRGVPNWPSPVANGFITFPHGPPPAGFHPVVQQFSSPSLFGIRPSMDISHSGVSYHMHETPDRFSNHARPFGWRNPAEESLPPHLQGWDGNNGVFRDESHIYGRPDWEQDRHLFGSRGWEMNADMWKRQNGSLNMEFPVPPKEVDYSTRVPADETSVGQSNNRPRSERSQLERPSVETIAMKQLNDTLTKNAAKAPSRVISKKTPEPSKLSSGDGARFCCTYLSKLDISVDLARPELYKQYMSLLGSEDRSDSMFPKHLCPQNVREDSKVAVKSSSHLLSSLFPATTGAAFQRAMCLYKKQGEGMGANITSLFLRTKKREPPINPDVEEEVEPVGNNLIPEDTPQANISSSPNNNNMEEDSSIATDAKGNLPCDAVEQQSDNIPNVAVYAEGPSQASKALVPDCRVDLTRIHHNPESTH